MLTTEIKQSSRPARNALLKQMQGRVVLSDMIRGSIQGAKNRSSLSSYYNSIVSVSLPLAQIDRLAEYKTAVTLMTMHDPTGVSKAITTAVLDGQSKCDLDMALANAARKIMTCLWVHKHPIDEVCLAGGKVESYISAYAGALDAGAERLFLSLDSRRLAHALRKGEGSKITYRIFKLLPYFEHTEYIFHAMENDMARGELSVTALQNLKPDEKKTLGSQRFLSSRILSGSSANRYAEAVRVCTGNQEAFRFLSYLAHEFAPATWSYAVEHADRITNAGTCIRILDVLKNDQESRDSTLSLMASTGYDKAILKAITAKVRADIVRYAESVKDQTRCMMAAWVLDRNDVLQYGQEDWWKHSYEDVVLYAMVHKWDRFLAGIADNEKLREVATYLRCNGIQVNANLLSDAQLIRVADQDMLSAPLPEWLKKNGTYDQIEAYHTINKDEPTKSTPFLNRIFETLSKRLRSETAGKRMLQYVLARNAIFKPEALTEAETAEIIDCLSEKDLYAWAAASFRFKASHGLAAAALPYLRINKVLTEAENEQDAWFILRNPDLCKDGLEHAKQTFCQTDKKVLWLKDFLGLDDQFYEKYKQESTEFLLASTEIAEAYARDLRGADQQKFRLIVKAAMCGKLQELKFHNGDLDSEIGMATSQRAAAAWIPDISIACKDKFGGTCTEDSSFNGIMSIGVNPMWTCMNYRNGSYKECLVSYFDANKKILYRRDANGQIIARAVLRFTKATDGETRDSGRLDFVDVESEQKSEGYPILFLERMYSGYQGTDRGMLAQSLIRAAGEKAAQMGVSLVLAYDYMELGITPAGFSKMRVSVYITKSKSSAQYLDSFGGKATYGSGEDSFQSTTCLIRRV